MRAVITKKIVEANDFGNNYTIGNYVYFLLNRNNKTYNCCGRIEDITDKWFSIKEVRLDDMKVSDLLIIKYDEVECGILSENSNIFNKY